MTVRVATSFSASSIDLTAGKVGARSGNPMTDSPLSAYEGRLERQYEAFCLKVPTSGGTVFDPSSLAGGERREARLRYRLHPIIKATKQITKRANTAAMMRRNITRPGEVVVDSAAGILIEKVKDDSWE